MRRAGLLAGASRPRAMRCAWPFLFPDRRDQRGRASYIGQTAAAGEVRDRP